MSPVGHGVFSMTRFYGVRELAGDLAAIAPGMTRAEVRDALGGARQGLAGHVVLYESGLVVDDPLLQACRSGSQSALPLIWIALVMADHRLAGIVEDYLTDDDGKLIFERSDADRLEIEVGRVLAEGRRTRKPATNILSYMRDSGLIEPRMRGGTTVGILRTYDTGPHVREAVRYLLYRLQHLEVPYDAASDDVDVALSFKANHWLGLTAAEFRASYEGTPPDAAADARPPVATAAQAPPIASEVAVEANNTESYEVSGRTRTALRREQPLVLAYKNWMRGRSEIVRLKFRPPNVPAHLYNDIYDKTRNHLIEGKADASRPSIRMAIGQLHDYRRYAPDGSRLAVLTERRPHSELEQLLDSLGIACIWRTEEGFVDNANGAFV